MSLKIMMNYSEMENVIYELVVSNNSIKQSVFSIIKNKENLEQFWEGTAKNEFCTLLDELIRTIASIDEIHTTIVNAISDFTANIKSIDDGGF